MESPPPYMPPQKKKMSTGMLIALILGGVALCCILLMVALGGGVLYLFNNGKQVIECSFAYRDVRDSLLDYAKDHGGKLPNAANWQQEVTPYYQNVAAQRPEERKIFKPMPASGAWGCDNGDGGRSGMALNSEAAGKALSELEASSSVMLFEVQQATQNASTKYVATEYNDANSPKILGKHRGWFLIRASGPPNLLSKGQEVPINSSSKFD